VGGYKQNVCNQGENKQSGGEWRTWSTETDWGMQKQHHGHEDEILSSTPMHYTLSSANGQLECDVYSNKFAVCQYCTVRGVPVRRPRKMISNKGRGRQIAGIDYTDSAKLHGVLYPETHDTVIEAKTIILRYPTLITEVFSEVFRN
jgi:hypothetical protein